jgi:GNAT superfamily N-acetyltransferase
VDLRIRLATVADIPGMHRVRKAVRENRLSDHTSITEASYLRFIEAGCAWLAEVGTAIAGFAAIDPKARSVWALFVAPPFEGQGVGRALHNTLLDGARDLGCTELALSTQRDSRAAEFYRSLGWREQGVAADDELAFKRKV